jgi:putative phosphoesterase
MKILLLADIHANWIALSAIRETYDVCLFLGDLVEYGTDPVPCIDWIRSHAHLAIRGNHDHSTAQRVATTAVASGCRRLAAATRAQHVDVLTSSHYKFLARLPVTSTTTLDDKSFYLVHATPRDPMDEYLGADPQGWEQRLRGIDADFICVGHTHIPMELDLGRQKVINPGSVGQPRDGDPRAAYAVIENGRVHFRRAEYDIDAVIRQMRVSGLDDEAIAIAEDMLRTGGRPIKAEPFVP